MVQCPHWADIVEKVGFAFAMAVASLTA